MREDIAKKWVKALRSGEYKQGSYSLRNEKNEFCCLGVLCNIHAQEHPVLAATQISSKTYLGSSSYLPFEVKEWAEMTSKCGQLPSGKFTVGNEDYYDLAQMNDEGNDFATIANWIESNYKEL